MATAFSDLHLLSVLAQTRSYTQAARRLGISKASASTRYREVLGMNPRAPASRAPVIVPASWVAEKITIEERG